MTSQRSKKKTKSTREIKFRMKSKGQKSSDRSEVMKNYDAEKQQEKESKKYKT